MDDTLLGFLSSEGLWFPFHFSRMFQQMINSICSFFFQLLILWSHFLLFSWFLRRNHDHLGSFPLLMSVFFFFFSFPGFF